MQYIIFTFPGKASIITWAPWMATLLHPELIVGKSGCGPVSCPPEVASPPPPPAPVVECMQQRKSVGPGQKFRSVMPEAHDETKEQVPVLSVPHFGFVQHLIFSAVPGQALEIKSPPSRVQESVGTQMPGTLSAPVHGPLISERARRWIGTVDAKAEVRHETKT